MARLIQSTGRLITWLLVVALAAGIVASLLLPVFNLEKRAVTTDSMKAAGMPAGSLVIIEKIAPEDARIGDVITYQQFSGKESAVTHRIVGLATESDGSTRWQTKGDSNPKPDPTPIREEQIIGRVTFVVPVAGWIAAIPPSTALLGGFAALALLWWIPDAVSKMRARKREGSSSQDRAGTISQAPETEWSI